MVTATAAVWEERRKKKSKLKERKSFDIIELHCSVYNGSRSVALSMLGSIHYSLPLARGFYFPPLPRFLLYSLYKYIIPTSNEREFSLILEKKKLRYRSAFFEQLWPTGWLLFRQTIKCLENSCINREGASISKSVLKQYIAQNLYDCYEKNNFTVWFYKKYSIFNF